MTELHLELLLNQPVVDTNGKTIGRIEEVLAEQQGQDWVVQEFLIGSAALLERLSVRSIALRLLNALGAHKLYSGYRIPWNKLDLSDPLHPRLTCTLSELQKTAAQNNAQSQS